MIRRPAAVAARAARAVRGLWPDRNPLRRTIDRIEAAVAGALVVAFLAGAPLAAAAGGHAAYGIAARTARAQQAAWHQVPAVLLATAPAAGYRQHQVSVPARWTAPDGTRHAGTVLASPGTRAGRLVLVWVDTAGRPVGDPPLQLSQARAQAGLATMLTPLALGLILLGAGWLAHVMLGRRQLAAWDADWQVTGPHWTRGRRVLLALMPWPAREHRQRADATSPDAASQGEQPTPRPHRCPDDGTGPGTTARSEKRMFLLIRTSGGSTGWQPTPGRRRATPRQSSPRRPACWSPADRRTWAACPRCPPSRARMRGGGLRCAPG